MNSITKLSAKIVFIATTLLNVGMCSAQVQPTAVKSETLLVTSSSWNGQSLPSYPDSQPKIHIMRYTIEPHTKMAVHRHAIISGGVVLQGVLTIVSETGEEKSFHAGKALVETTDTWHYGENRGDTTVVVVMMYAGADDIPLSEKRENK